MTAFFVGCQVGFRRRTKGKVGASGAQARRHLDGSSDGNLQRVILSLALPALGALCLDPLMSLVDTICIGRGAGASPIPLAATGAASAIVGVALGIFNFLTSATTPLVASRRAAGDLDGAASIGGQALTLALAIGVAITVALSVAAAPLLTSIGSRAAGTLSVAIVLVRVRAAAAPAVLLVSACVGIMRGCLDARTPLCVLAAATALNVFLDILLIFGLGWGALGAALATTVAEWSAALTLLAALRRGITTEGQRPLQVHLARSTSSLSDALPLLRASSAVFGRTLVLQGALTASTALAAFGGGASAAAAHEVARQLWSLCAFVADSLAAAAQALVANALGSKDRAAARRVAGVITLYGLVLGIGLAVCLMGLISIGAIPGFLTRDAATITAVRPLLMIVVLAQPLNALVFVADGIIQGAQDFSFQFRSMAFACMLAAIALVTSWRARYGMVPELVDIWIGLLALSVGRGLTAAWRYIGDPHGPLRDMPHRSSGGAGAERS